MVARRAERSSLEARARGVAFVTLLGLTVCAIALALTALLVWVMA